MGKFSLSRSLAPPQFQRDDNNDVHPHPSSHHQHRLYSDHFINFPNAHKQERLFTKFCADAPGCWPTFSSNCCNSCTAMEAVLNTHTSAPTPSCNNNPNCSIPTGKKGNAEMNCDKFERKWKQQWNKNLVTNTGYLKSLKTHKNYCVDTLLFYENCCESCERAATAESL